jgi:hypothetical protein
VFYLLEVLEYHFGMVHHFHLLTLLLLLIYHNRVYNTALNFHSTYLTVVRELLYFFYFELTINGSVDHINESTNEIVLMDMVNAMG